MNQEINPVEFGIEPVKAKEIKEKFEAFKKWSLTQVNNL